MNNNTNTNCIRNIYLHEDINPPAIRRVNQELLAIIEEDNNNDKEKKEYERQPIKLFINSYGGNVDDMWSLIDIIENSKTPIHTYCTGYAMSAAFCIFIAGHKRFCTEHTTFMYHQIQAGAYGRYQDIVERKDELSFNNRQIEKYVLSHTKLIGCTVKEVREKKLDMYIHSDKAIELGIVDEVINDGRKVS